ncbi:COP9 signalosome complex subunit 8-like [Dendrobates tinctorius]|uniref:COP9 signalosome complex subunit 8-like n=1 Tax=Dendrobates tinctorius TaxID=92724 RepID=UPI003CC94266
MPVAVMAENPVSYQKLLEQCEEQELEAPGGVATPQVYSQLLVLYLLHNDMNNARYLWKRIPPAVRSSSPEIGWIWEVGKRIWQRDFPGIYSSIAAHQWSENIQPIIEAVRGKETILVYFFLGEVFTIWPKMFLKFGHYILTELLHSLFQAMAFIVELVSFFKFKTWADSSRLSQLTNVLCQHCRNIMCRI